MPRPGSAADTLGATTPPRPARRRRCRALTASPLPLWAVPGRRVVVRPEPGAGPGPVRAPEDTRGSWRPQRRVGARHSPKRPRRSLSVLDDAPRSGAARAITAPGSRAAAALGGLRRAGNDGTQRVDHLVRRGPDAPGTSPSSHAAQRLVRRNAEGIRRDRSDLRHRLSGGRTLQVSTSHVGVTSTTSAPGVDAPSPAYRPPSSSDDHLGPGDQRADDHRPDERMPEGHSDRAVAGRRGSHLAAGRLHADPRALSASTRSS